MIIRNLHNRREIPRYRCVKHDSLVMKYRYALKSKLVLQLVVKCLSPQRNSDPAMVEARRVNVLPLAINHLVFVDF